MYISILLFLTISVSKSSQIILAINCGSQKTVQTKFFNYTSDSFFSERDSIVEQKGQSLDALADTDRELAKWHRTTFQSKKQFFYTPVLSSGYYIAILSAIQTQFSSRAKRVFNIKLGDDIVHTVDIWSEVGSSKMLHKWIQFQIKDQIAFLNGTIPALNAYNFKTHQIKIGLESKVNKPKIQAFVLLKGRNSNQLLNQFLRHQEQKNNKQKQFVSFKYRRQPKLPYRTLTSQDIIPPPDSEFMKILKNYISFKSLGSIICAILAIHYEKIFLFAFEWSKKVRDEYKAKIADMQKKNKQK